MKIRKLIYLLSVTVLLGCASANVDVTKTGKGYYEPTKASLVQILKTIPEKSYVELGAVTVSGFGSNDVAKMHNAIRAESAPLGADAVIITDEGLTPDGWGVFYRWATGVAIKYSAE